MKKLLTLIAFVLVTFTVDAQSTQKGDINGDGDISVNDVAMIVNYILGITDSDFIITNADINGDGEIDINDVMATVSIILEGNSDTPQAYLTCPDNHHPHMIDLGLPSGTKWACCNVGADKPEAYGGYYAWGETEEKSVYNDVTYEYATGVDENGDGWYDDYHNDLGTYGIWQTLGNYIGENELGESIYDIAGTEYDVAHVKWGGSWVMPSHEQQLELLNICSSQWTQMNGVNGRSFTGPSGGTIFQPAAGLRWNEVYNSSYGGYWSSTQDPSNPDGAYGLDFRSGYQDWDYNFDYRRHGRTVRPIAK